MPSGESVITWVVLTMGDRQAQLDRAIASLVEMSAGPIEIIVVVNDPEADVVVPQDVRVERQSSNLGVPGGRDVGARLATTDLVGFLDDDAELRVPASRIALHFDENPRGGVVSLRLVDESGETARRHIPRFGRRGATESGPVATFLGGASVMRRDAYLQVGGYFTELRYGHEELELSWRLIDEGWSIHYLAYAEVFHPRTEISRHVDGWRMTGRNRVLIARRTLPRPIAVIHAVTWLGLGLVRAPGNGSRRTYVSGWLRAWRMRVKREPIRWRTVTHLTRLGRPPLV